MRAWVYRRPATSCLLATAGVLPVLYGFVVYSYYLPLERPWGWSLLGGLPWSVSLGWIARRRTRAAAVAPKHNPDDEPVAVALVAGLLFGTGLTLLVLCVLNGALDTAPPTRYALVDLSDAPRNRTARLVGAGALQGRRMEVPRSLLRGRQTPQVEIHPGALGWPWYRSGVATLRQGAL